MTGIERAIQILTCAALVGLLGAVGLRLTLVEVRAALRRSRFVALLLANFIIVPALAVAAAQGFGVKREIAIAMLLLAASPFAPVVPVFARLARADLALAAVLTGLFPLAAAFLTPLATQAELPFVDSATAVHLDLWQSLVLLLATITLPLGLGVVVRHFAPETGRRLLRPIEILAETTGAASLIFVTVTQFPSIMRVEWPAWLAMALVSEASLLLGWQIGGPGRGARQVVALGTSNRNIALALLMAVQSFHGTEVMAGVVSNGLLLIALGLVHVAWWRFSSARVAT